MNNVSRDTKSGSTTDQIDILHMPLSRVGTLAKAGLLGHILPDPSVNGVSAAAFQSSI